VNEVADKFNFPGSKWLKFDFHTHTPKSNHYGCGDESLENMEPEVWLRNAMAAELDCVVVTDHNSADWIDLLQAKNQEFRDHDPKPEWYRELTIFPGAEITVANSSNRVHLLAVFDPSCDSRKVTSVLGSCGITSGFGDDLNTSTTTGFVETVRKITEANGIAIPAHIDGSKGLLENITALTPELEKSLKEIIAAEFCDLHKFDNADPSLKKAIDCLAKVAGSDAHKPDDIGKHFSWLKMSRPSIEGLRLALWDHEFCVKNQTENPNHLPDIFLTKLTIKAMRHCGRISERPFVIQLHPHFNSIIGGRGTGKSTVLESIRIVTRRDKEVEPFAKINTELERFIKDQRGPKKERGVMEDDTEILLELHRRGKNYRLRWRFDGEGTVLKEEVGNIWQAIEAGDLRERFPLSIFSQKQINELALNPRGLLEIVDRSPEVDRAEWKSRWESVKSHFLQLRERRRELLRQLTGEQQIRVKLGDLENDLKQYEEKGHGVILKQYQKRNQQKNGLPDDHIFDELTSGIRELAANAGLSDFPAHLFDEQDETTSEIKAIHEGTAQELKKVGETLNKLADEVDTLKSKRTGLISASKWQKAFENSIAAYDGLVKEYEEKKGQLSISLYGEWVYERNQLQRQLKRLDSIRKETESTEKKIDESLTKLQALRNELLKKRRDFLDEIIGGSAFVRMELVPYGDVSTLEEEYRSLLNLEDGKFVSSVYDRENKQGILWELNSWEEATISEFELPQLISQVKADTFDIARGQATSIHNAFVNRLKKTLETQAVAFDQLDAWWPEDLLRVQYAKKPGLRKFDDLEKGSAGQKAAAILAFLLSYGNEPLIIDQPEDDLDNALIYDLVVRQIHENKNRRQLIIVTHNPNIVVNGDSELIHVLKYEAGQIQIDQKGGLEESNIRELICTIMEGGKDAFDKRYARIRAERFNND
jgi:ABC-type lipoprotein export system ATPase subunit/histidinol phosphatase-like PHP family hydrolase